MGKMKNKLNVVAVPYGALPCCLQTFTINGIVASESDFGSSDSEGDGDYGCEYHYFIPNENPSEGVLDKYGITKKQYDEVCDILEAELHVGSCGWCS